MTLKEAIARVSRGDDLERDEAAAVMHLIMAGEATPAQIGGLLVAMNIKGRAISEIAGFAETMRSFATRVATTRRPLVDTAGTGGDHKGTFNMSTTAAFVIAGAGVAVAKHGNRSATSKCGSADVLEALGVKIELPAERIGHCIDEIGIGFLFARGLHTAMRFVAPVRSELGVPTIFNILGPLTNPADACGQIMGVYDAELVEPIAIVLGQLGTRHAFVVAGRDGLDEISLSSPSLVAETTGGVVATYEIEPELYGVDTAPIETLRGGDANENAVLLRRVLEGEEGPRRDVVLLNAAPAIVAGEAAKDLHEGVARAREAIDSGAALAKLDALIHFTGDSQ